MSCVYGVSERTRPSTFVAEMVTGRPSCSTPSSVVVVRDRFIIRALT